MLVFSLEFTFWMIENLCIFVKEMLFQDVVDIVVGWYVETDPNTELSDKCEETVESLHALWLENIDVCMKFLPHFLEDAEGYVKVTDLLSIGNTLKKKENDSFDMILQRTPNSTLMQK